MEDQVSEGFHSNQRLPTSGFAATSREMNEQVKSASEVQGLN